MEPVASIRDAAPGPPTPPSALPEIEFAIERATVPRAAATPVVTLTLRAEAPAGMDVHSLLLECMVRIAPRRRPYPEQAERERLVDLFGPQEQWGQSLQGLLWASVPVFVPRFSGSTEVELSLPCSYDFEVSAARYLSALAGGAVPLEVMFSGTAFWAGEDGRPRVGRIPLDREAAFDLPVELWREAVDRHFPGAAWLRLSRDRHARLQAYRASAALPSWDAVVDELLAAVPGPGAGGGER